MGVSKVLTVPVGKVVGLGKAVAKAGGHLGGHIVSKMKRAETPKSRNGNNIFYNKNNTQVVSPDNKHTSDFGKSEKNLDYRNELRKGVKFLLENDANSRGIFENHTSEPSDISVSRARSRKNGFGSRPAAPTPAEVGKIISDDISDKGGNSEYAFRLDLTPPKAGTADNPNRLCGMDQLRRCLRAVHGQDRREFGHRQHCEKDEWLAARRDAEGQDDLHVARQVRDEDVDDSSPTGTMSWSSTAGRSCRRRRTCRPGRTD